MPPPLNVPHSSSPPVVFAEGCDGEDNDGDSVLLHALAGTVALFHAVADEVLAGAGVLQALLSKLSPPPTLPDEYVFV